MKLWRYMPISQYIDLLSTGKLFIPKTKILSDKFEGAWFSKTEKILFDRAETSVDTIVKWYEEIEKRSESEFRAYFAALDSFQKMMEESGGITKNFFDGIITYENYKQKASKEKKELLERHSMAKKNIVMNEYSVNEIKESTYVSSWSHSNEQNLALWKIFGKGDDSIAITTTRTKLEYLISRNSDYLKGLNLQAVVESINYLENIHYPSNDTYRNMLEIVSSRGFPNLGSLLIKPKPYEFEKEVRLIVFPFPIRQSTCIGKVELEIMLTPSFEDYFRGEMGLIEAVYLPPNLEKGSVQYKAVVEINKIFKIICPIKIDRIEI